MHSANHWGGSFEIQVDPITEEGQSRNMEEDRAMLLRQQLDETQQGWLLGFLLIGIPIVIVRHLPNHTEPMPPPDAYTVALHKALRFFNGQKSGRLPKSNGISWRGDSGLRDGSRLSDVKGGLVGGYYDAGDNIKFHFPMAFSMTLLSWSVIEYGHKYKAIGEYDHILDIIKWGTDYLLRTFNSSATTINKIYSQVGYARKGSTSPDDEHYCWQRPEDINYHREVLFSTSAPDLGSEVAAALAAASIVFHHEKTYSKKLVKAATTAFKFATAPSQRSPYSSGNDLIAPFYNSSGFWDEFIWGAAWMYYATGNYSYISFATNPELPNNANAFSNSLDLSVFSWDNKLPAAELLLSRFRIFLNPGYPYEDILKRYHATSDQNMCFLLKQFQFFKWTKGGLILLNHGRPQPLQYAVKAAFLASLYADYMNESNIPGWYCGSKFISSSALTHFATSQVNYILGKNPKNMSYVVGYGHKYPRHVHHRAASIPHNHKRYTCTGGWKWRDAKPGNPNTITGAMVGGPDRFDHFLDVRKNHNYSEPTLVANAGLVAALVALTGSGGQGIDRNTMFSTVQALFPPPHPPPSSWIHP
ncbi:uncharacterized protein A4U43_C02F12220 [Asparagus officinalis]|uniref:Endoglucanase n=1 Tax=Asparagus officinalis TaxID=4686 RepID=A0A5P1FJM2_ASPOF|nr:uncharacterized protein A4U43_C02F12220 [Asparagus officinalis]